MGKFREILSYHDFGVYRRWRQVRMPRFSAGELEGRLAAIDEDVTGKVERALK